MFLTRFSLALFALIIQATPAWPQAPEPLFGPTQEIPRDYKSWSLFLVCNPEWLLDERRDDLIALYHRFDAFGHSIGPDHAAIWFWKTEDRDALFGDTPPGKLIDVGRSANYCARYGLLPSEGPHVLITTRHPDDDEPGDRSVLKLNGLDPDDIVTLLAKLADQVLVTGLQQEDLDSERSWRRWLGAAETVFDAGFGWIDRVKLAIDTKFFTLEIEGGR
jgi:hypothetical protein